MKASRMKAPYQLLTLLPLLALAGSIEAATFTVTNADDSGAGSLRMAVADANASGDPVDTIEFDPTFFSTP